MRHKNSFDSTKCFRISTQTFDWKLLGTNPIFSMGITIIMVDSHRIVIIWESADNWHSLHILLCLPYRNIINPPYFCSKHCVGRRWWAQALITCENGSYHTHLHPLSMRDTATHNCIQAHYSYIWLVTDSLLLLYCVLIHMGTVNPPQLVFTWKRGRGL